MSGRDAEGARLRLFVALELPVDVRGALASWAEAAAPRELRRVPQDNLHVTLAFLGSRPAPDADAVAAQLPSLARPLGALATAGALWLPPRRPGVLSVALAGGPQLEALQSSLIDALGASIGYEPERRRFRPHVTVGRVPRGGRISASELPDPPSLTFEAPAVTLYRSRTGPRGSRYEAIARAEL